MVHPETANPVGFGESDVKMRIKAYWTDHKVCLIGQYLLGVLEVSHLCHVLRDTHVTKADVAMNSSHAVRHQVLTRISKRCGNGTLL